MGSCHLPFSGVSSRRCHLSRPQHTSGPNLPSCLSTTGVAGRDVDHIPDPVVLPRVATWEPAVHDVPDPSAVSRCRISRRQRDNRRRQPKRPRQPAPPPSLHVTVSRPAAAEDRRYRRGRSRARLVSVADHVAAIATTNNETFASSRVDPDPPGRRSTSKGLPPDEISSVATVRVDCYDA